MAFIAFCFYLYVIEKLNLLEIGVINSMRRKSQFLSHVCSVIIGFLMCFFVYNVKVLWTHRRNLVYSVKMLAHCSNYQPVKKTPYLSCKFVLRSNNNDLCGAALLHLV